MSLIKQLFKQTNLQLKIFVQFYPFNLRQSPHNSWLSQFEAPSRLNITQVTFFKKWTKLKRKEKFHLDLYHAITWYIKKIGFFFYKNGPYDRTDCMAQCISLFVVWSLNYTLYLAYVPLNCNTCSSSS